MKFYTSDASGSAPNLVERMIINEAGKVGIGTSTPAYELDVPSGTVRGKQVFAKYGSNKLIQLTWGGTTSEGRLWIGNNDSPTVIIDGNSNSYINNGANFGIGTTAPEKALHIKSAANQIRIQDSTNNKKFDLNVDGDKFMIDDMSVGANRFAIASDGKVGIGTSTPTAQLQTTGDVIVGGNLTVSGTTFTVDTSNVLVEDPVLLLAKNQTGGAALDAGFIIERGDDTNVGFIWDESADQFAVINTTEIADDNDITIASYAAFKAGASAFTGVVTTNNLEPINGNDTGYLGSSSNKWKQVYFGILEATTANFSGTVTCHGSIDLQDNDKLLLGAGNDLEIYHDGSHSYISETGTGRFPSRSGLLRRRLGEKHYQ